MSVPHAIVSVGFWTASDTLLSHSFHCSILDVDASFGFRLLVLCSGTSVSVWWNMAKEVVPGVILLSEFTTDVRGSNNCQSVNRFQRGCSQGSGDYPAGVRDLFSWHVMCWPTLGYSAQKLKSKVPLQLSVKFRDWFPNLNLQAP